ncbi:MAG: alpha/beta hydrolase [Planctomycetales bacterium]|nr:alpha/beta hydrolase [Planctomycetales bacterium]
MFAAQSFDLKEVKLNVVAGPAAGDPLLLLHGVSRSSRDFAPLFPALTARWQVYAVDQRGHGQSSRAKRYLVRDYAADVVELLQSRPVFRPAVIYGHSLGALVATCVAAQYPEAVRAVILEDPPTASMIPEIRQTSFFPHFAAMQKLSSSRLPTSEVARQLAEVRLPGVAGEVRLGDLRDGVSLRLVARCLQEVDPAVYDTLLAGRWMEGVDWIETIRAVRCPVLLLAADEKAGGMLTRSAADEMKQNVADIISLPHPGIGHLIHWQATETCLRHTLGFLESL